jgi:hypothetical protein
LAPALLILCLAVPALGQEARPAAQIATLRILTYDDPADLLFESVTYRATVGPGIEFGAAREGREGIDTVPVLVDIENGRIEFSYIPAAGPDRFTQAVFNGYELSFAPCLRFDDLTVTEAVGIALTPDRVFSVGNRLFVNVSALDYTAQSRFTLRVKAAPCVAS